MPQYTQHLTLSRLEALKHLNDVGIKAVAALGNRDPAEENALLLNTEDAMTAR